MKLQYQRSDGRKRAVRTCKFGAHASSTIHRGRYGWIFDQATGRPIRHHGLEFRPESTDHPSGCHRALSPVRMASQLRTIYHQIDLESNENGALIGTPIYDGRNYRGAGRYFGLMRVHPGREAALGEDIGEYCEAVSLLAAWNAYASDCCNLQDLLPEAHADDQMHASIRRRKPKIASQYDAVSTINHAIVGAIVTGSLLRLDDGVCPDEHSFLTALSHALATLPAAARAHVSFSAGWTWPDDDVQIAWSKSIGGNRTDQQELAALAQIGRDADFNSTICRCGIVPAFPTHAHVYLSRLVPSCENNGMHAIVRSAVSNALTEALHTDGVADQYTYDQTRHEERKRAAEADTFINAACDYLPKSIVKHVYETGTVNTQELDVWLARQICLDESQLKDFADFSQTRLHIAGRLKAGDRSLKRVLENSLALLAMRAGYQKTRFKRLAGAFVPDSRLARISWSDFRNTAPMFAGMIKEVAEGQDRISPQALHDLASAALDTGRGDLVQSTATVMCASSWAPDDPIDALRRLQLTSAILKAVDEHHADGTSSNIVNFGR